MIHLATHYVIDIYVVLIRSKSHGLITGNAHLLSSLKQWRIWAPLSPPPPLLLPLVSRLLFSPIIMHTRKEQGRHVCNRGGSGQAGFFWRARVRAGAPRLPVESVRNDWGKSATSRLVSGLVSGRAPPVPIPSMQGRPDGGDHTV